MALAPFEIGFVEFYMAGNCLNERVPKDIDLFPVKHEPNFKIDPEKIIVQTRNAITLKSSPPVQICNFLKSSLKELIDSFDYNHIQVGAKIKIDGEKIETEEVHFTDDFVKSRMIGDAFYTGSDYPLSSLIRTFKYNEKGNFLGKSYIFSVLPILVDIVKRGFHSYEDFKDQLDAVDLGLLPEDFKHLNDGVLFELFNLLNREKK